MRDRQSFEHDETRRLASEVLEARRVLAAAISDGLGLWELQDSSVTEVIDQPSYIRAQDYRLFSLDHELLSGQLDAAPLEFVSTAETQPLLTVPRPDGEFDTFRIVSSPIMAPELAAQFPEIQTFAGQSIENSATNIRLDLTPAGFHAQVISPDGNYYVDPYFHLSDELYASYFVSGEFDVSDLGEISLHGDVHDEHEGHDEHDDADELASRFGSGSALVGNASVTAGRSGSELRTYRTAIAATGEYVAFHGGTLLSGAAAIVTAVNRVSGIYENELAIRLELVANNSTIIYTDAANDPYTNNNAGALLGENQTNLDNVIGVANYDVGHVFSTGAGGLASLGSVGIDARKAQGATGLPVPTGDPFYVDFVAHELGHQFGGNHTFNGDSAACAGNRNPGTAMEPGSGSTIQAYAGICGDDDLQSNSDPFFHSISFDEMIRHVDTVIPHIGTRINTGNSIPTISTELRYVIPANTPFMLTADGQDADAGDTLTYSWEQRDVGPQQDVSAGDNGQSPLFRAWPPTEDSTRYFPRLSDLVAGTTTIGETLPTTNRSMTFRATVRDNHFGSGGVNTSDTQLQVVDTGAPFVVTSQNTSVAWDGLTQQTVTWDVAGTDVAPIAASEVTIRLSIDGGLTYPFLVASAVPNNGSADVVIPNVQTTQGRLLVQGAGNVFFDINDTDISITEAPIAFDLGAGQNAVFTENQQAVLVAPDAIIDNPSGLSLDLLSISVSVGAGMRVGDSVSIRSSGVGPGEISVIGNTVAYGGATIGTLDVLGGVLQIQLNGAATSAAGEALLRSIQFEHVGDNPGIQSRSIDFLFGGATRHSRVVDVIPVNDSPQIASVELPTILEDTTVFEGTRIADLYAGGTVQDSDDFSSMVGLAVVGNAELLSQGAWFFSSDQATWRPVSNIFGLNASLVLSSQDFLAFRPAPDFFGTPAALQVRALDNTYNGSFSSSITGFRIPLDPAHLAVNGAASNVAEVSIDVTNVNDRPVANDSEVVINLSQDQAIDRVLPETLFSDIDSPQLQWDLRLVGTNSLPSWLTFDPVSRQLAGTPENRHVGIYQLTLGVTDDEPSSAEIPMVITVNNVNDAPESLRITGTEIGENVANQPIGQLFASDPDSGDRLTWTVSDTRFFVRENSLFVGSPLDFEAEQTVNLRMTVTDSGTPPKAANLDIVIDVQDENEFFPDLIGGSFSVDDGTAAGTLVSVLNATDGDTSNSLRYRITNGDTDAFSLDESTGELRLAQPANIQQQSNYKLFVEVADNGLPVKSRVVQVNVDVTPVNRFAPEAFSPQNFSVSENAVAGQVFGRVLATDADGNPLSYELVSATDQVEIDPSTGDLRTTTQTSFDFEASNSFEFIVRVTEDVAPNRSVQTVVSLAITDANDPPHAVTANRSIPVARQGVTVGLLDVADQDPSSNYSFSTNDARFEFVGDSLQLKPDAHFEPAEAGTAQIMIQVTDALDPSSTSLLPLTLDIVDVSPWTNLANSLDTTRDGTVAPVDALVVVNALNQLSGGGQLSQPRTLAEQQDPDVDTNGDGFLTPVDALLVVNFLNDQAGQGEGEPAEREPAEREAVDVALADDELWSVAFLDLELEERRRRSGGR